MEHHSVVEKLNMQAHQSAKGGHDEFIVDNINRESKSIILLHNLLLIEHVKK